VKFGVTEVRRRAPAPSVDVLPAVALQVHEQFDLVRRELTFELMNGCSSSDDYCTRIGTTRQVERLLGTTAGAAAAWQPFLSHEFLQALHATGCASLRPAGNALLTLWKSGVLAARYRCIASIIRMVSTL